MYKRVIPLRKIPLLDVFLSVSSTLTISYKYFDSRLDVLSSCTRLTFNLLPLGFLVPRESYSTLCKTWNKRGGWGLCVHLISFFYYRLVRRTSYRRKTRLFTDDVKYRSVKDDGPTSTRCSLGRPDFPKINFSTQ